MLLYFAKDGKNEDARDFLRLLLEALDEELVKLQTYISTHELVSAPSVEKLEGGGQTEVKEQDYAVRWIIPRLSSPAPA